MKWRDPKWKYRNSVMTSSPGYLARRMKAYARLQRMRSRCNVKPIKKAAA